jgi:hypothetical protein
MTAAGDLVCDDCDGDNRSDVPVDDLSLFNRCCHGQLTCCTASQTSLGFRYLVSARALPILRPVLHGDCRTTSQPPVSREQG